jgi:hypothetical protein
MKAAYLVASLVVGVVSPGIAQTNTNVAQTVSQLLTAIGPVPYTATVTYWSECVERSGDPPRLEVFPCQKTKVVTTNNVLTASNIAIVSHSDVQFGTQIYTDYPDDLNASFLTIRNCSPVPPPPNPSTPPPTQVVLSTTITRTTSVTFSQSITQGGSTNLGFNLGATIDGIKGGITGGVTVTNSSTTGSATTTTDATGVTQTETGTYSEPWMSTSLVGVSAYRVGITIPISFTATVDADLSPNNRGLKRLSDALTVVQRTFSVVCQIATDAASKAQLTYYAPTPVEPSDCTAPGISTSEKDGGEVNLVHIRR